MARGTRRWQLILSGGLLGLLAWSATFSLAAWAAPGATVNVRPTQVSQGTVARIYARDVTPGTALSVTLTSPTNVTSFLTTVRADPRGQVALGWPIQPDLSLGAYTINLTSGASTALTSSFTVVPATAPTLTVFPAQGSPATLFSFVSAGFTPGQSATLVLKGPDNLALVLPVAAGATGNLLTALPAGPPPTLHGAGFPIGTYSVGVRIRDVEVAASQFRVGPLPAGCHDKLSNPSFELEPKLVGWDQAGNPAVVENGAFLGQRLAILGGYNTADDRVAQTFALPEGTKWAELSYWRAMALQEPGGEDYLTVSLSQLDGSGLRLLERVDQNSPPNAWERVVVSLPLTASPQRLSFIGRTDARGPTAFGIDGAALLTCRDFPAPDIGPSVATVLPFVSDQAIHVGETVRVDVWVDNAENLYSADVTLSFDPTLLRPRTSQVQVGPLLQTAQGALIARNQINPDQGTAQFVITRLSPAAAITGSGVLFSLDFDAVGLGAGSLSISQARTAGLGGSILPVERQSTLVIVRSTPAVVTGRTQPQARSDASGTVIEVAGPVSATVTTNTVGDFRLDNLPVGEYRVTARRAGWLCAEQRVRLGVGQTMRLPLVRLLAGDVNSSGVIDLFDLIRVAVAYGAPEETDPVTDLDGSGETDINDLVLVAINYDQTCPQPWLPSPAKRRVTPALSIAPRLTLVPATPLPDGRVPVEVWAEGVDNVQGLDVTLSVDTARAAVDHSTPFRLAAALSQAFVALNRSQDGGARLAATLVAPAAPLTGRVHLATLVVQGDASGVSVERVKWVDGEGKTVGTVKPQPALRSGKGLGVSDQTDEREPVIITTGWRRMTEIGTR